MSLKYPHWEGRQRPKSLVTMVILRAAPRSPLMSTWVREGEGTRIGCDWVSSLISRSKRGGSQRGWGSFESPSRAGRKGSQPARPTCQTSALTKNLEVPCPQICPYWDGPQFELPVAVRFHLRGPPMEEGGVQGWLYLLLHFCGEIEEKRVGLGLTSHWAFWGLVIAFSRLWGAFTHSSSLTLSCLLSDHLDLRKGHGEVGVQGAHGKNV